MRFSPIQLYKIVQHKDYILICGPKDKLPNGEELIIADMPTCCEYLIRYHEARSRGLPLREAHAEALKGARVVHDPKLMAGLH